MEFELDNDLDIVDNDILKTKLFALLQGLQMSPIDWDCLDRFSDGGFSDGDADIDYVLPQPSSDIDSNHKAIMIANQDFELTASKVKFTAYRSSSPIHLATID